MPPSKTKTNVPAVKWAADDRALTYALIKALSDSPELKKDIWPAPGETASGEQKIELCRDLAKRVLEGHKLHGEFLTTPEGRRAYGTSVKNQLVQMEQKYCEAAKMLGAVGAGLNKETDLWKDEASDDIRYAWHEVKKSCPYFFELKPLLGERLFATDPAAGHSNDPVDTSTLLTGTLLTTTQAESGDAEEVNDLDTQNNDTQGSTTVDPNPCDSGLSDSSTRVPIHDSNGTVPSGAPDSSKNAPSTPGESVEDRDFAGFMDSLRTFTVVDHIRKRMRDFDAQAIQLLEMQKRHELKERRMRWKHELEMRRLDLEERELKLREQKAAEHHSQ